MKNYTTTWLIIAFLILFITPIVASAPIIDPTSAGFGGANRTNNIANLTDNWRRYQNVTFVVSVGGKDLEVVPWMSRGDQCLLVQSANGLHACQNTNPPFDNANLSNQTFCMVTDEMSQVILSDALDGRNATRMANWVNTIEAYQTCGQAGNLTEWTVGIRYTGSGNWEFNCSQVADSASDADAHIIVALAAINTSGIATTDTKTRAGNLLGAMCLGLADENFLPYNITNRINPGENITSLPCGGDDVCTNPGNAAFMYTAYNGPILEALAACQSYYGGDTQRNWTKLADNTVQAHLQASNWTGSTFTVGYGRSYHWANYTSTGTAYAVCDNSCTPAPYTDDPDGMRAPRLCNGIYVWESYRGMTLRNGTTYCQQWHDLAGENATSHVIERYFNSTPKSATNEGSYKAMGLGAFMNSLVNTSLADDRITQYNSHLGSGGAGGRLTMDSQACFGVYDKAFGIIALEYLIGAGSSAFTTNGTSNPPSSTSGGINITLYTPSNNTVTTSTSVLFNLTIWNNNNTNINNNTPGSLPQTIYNSTFTATPANDGWTLNSWTWTSDDGGLINNTANDGAAAWTQNLSLTQMTNGYNITMNMSVSNFTNAKIFFGTTSGTQSGDRILLERNGNSMNVKHDGGSFSSFTIAWKQYVTLSIYVNLTNNTVSARSGASSWSDTLANNHLTVNGSYLAFVPGQNMTGNQNSTGWNISGINVTNIGTSYNITTSITGNSTMNVTIAYANGTVISQQNGVTNASSVTYNLTGLTTGVYNWLVTVVSKDNTASITNLTFTINTTSPTITVLSIGSLNTTAIQINWTTDQSSNQSINYGNTTALGTLLSSSSFATTWTATIGDLQENTTYYFNITSCNDIGNCATNGTFNATTQASTPSPPTPNPTSGGVCTNVMQGILAFSTTFSVIGTIIGLLFMFGGIFLFKNQIEPSKVLSIAGIIGILVVATTLLSIIINPLC